MNAVKWILARIGDWAADLVRLARREPADGVDSEWTRFGRDGWKRYMEGYRLFAYPDGRWDAWSDAERPDDPLFEATGVQATLSDAKAAAVRAILSQLTGHRAMEIRARIERAARSKP